ncbi:cation:proton antiporter [Tessaracoccus sp. MC1679]|uniref:monovalent cation/H+ antiporter complex subunit F n=1 Tax=Tessaracoccus sp. MC1679 TaxID=2760313 RepID=UPI0016038EF6|nr:monovalent cation/H+ antiporter complex subunit F [Tessaracoccus sp. MC1679]MBB1514911.1 cation:proton antiporter [Tessaracoccus sp. MC1679]
MVQVLTDVILSVAAVVLTVSAIIGANRIAEGPTQLDRSVAADLIVAVVVASLGLWTVWSDSSTEVLILVLLSMLGFTSAVSVARMVADRMATRRHYSANRDRKGAQ